MAKNGKNWPFLAKISKTRIFFKNPLGTFFQPYQDVALCKKSSKSDARFSRYSVTHARTNERTDKRESFSSQRRCRETKKVNCTSFSIIFPHNLAKFQVSSTFRSQVLFENVFLRYRVFKIPGPFSAKTGLFQVNISQNPRNQPSLVVFYGLVCGGT